MMVFATHGHESAMGAHVSPYPEPPFLLPPHSIPLGCPRAPALGAVLHTSYLRYNVHVSMLFSQIIPPLPSPTECKSLFFTSVSPLLPCLYDCLNSISSFRFSHSVVYV